VQFANIQQQYHRGNGAPLTKYEIFKLNSRPRKNCMGRLVRHRGCAFIPDISHLYLLYKR